GCAVGRRVDDDVDAPEGRDRLGEQALDVEIVRDAIPHMLEQGSGSLLNVASAAGLLVIPVTVSYTVTKHAAIGFTEWLAVMYGDRGIGVSVLCPAAVRTRFWRARRTLPRDGTRSPPSSSPTSSWTGSPRSAL
ncbi:MAG: hypothetical protein QOI98_3349, partial [Solirubrobacteraceae bacterium]|nr:hypothetical protein [Solirubrobacteraceae bacterium]